MNALVIDVAILRTSSAVNEPRVVRESISQVKAGYNVLILAWDRQHEYCSVKHKIPTKTKWLHLKAPIGSLSLILYFPIFWLWAIVQAIIEKPLVIHACDFDAMPVGLIMKILRPRTKIIYDCFEYYPGMVSSFLNSQAKPIMFFIDKVFTKIADCVIVANEERKKFYPYAKKTLLVNNAPQTQNFEVEKESDFTVFYGGAIDADRGVETILKAASELDNVKFVIVGNGKLKIIVEQSAKLFKNITYLGFMPNNSLLKKMAASNVTIAFYDVSNPNNLLAASSKVFDSMMLGIPVITNEECLSSKPVLKHECGMVVPYGDANALSSVILLLKNDFELQKKMGQNGKTVFNQLYAWNILEAEYISQYKKIIEQKKQ